MSDVAFAPNVEEHLGRRAPDYALAVKAATEVLRESVITAPPVLPQQIAESYGMKVRFAKFAERFQNVSGFLDLEKQEIYVNADDPSNRQTFTIAHEFGHAQLHGSLFRKHPDDYQVLLRSPINAPSSALEKEANCFAANLLVPREFLDLYYRIATVRELSRLFIVSEDVIRFRLKNEYNI